MRTLKHRTADGTVHTRRTDHDYMYVVENGFRVVSWHGTRTAAQRKARSWQHVVRVNDGHRIGVVA